jgi:hypothetical protein
MRALVRSAVAIEPSQLVMRSKAALPNRATVFGSTARMWIQILRRPPLRLHASTRSSRRAIEAPALRIALIVIGAMWWYFSQSR